MSEDRLKIIYDGNCPFCTNYAHLVRIRENFAVELVDARQHLDLAAQYKSRGLDLAQGMIADINGRPYYGGEAIWILSTLSSRSGFCNRMIAFCFKNRAVSSALYPLLRSGRNLTLALMGRSREF